MRIIVARLILCLCVCLPLAAQAASPEAGKALTVKPGAFVERAGTRSPLTTGAVILAGDTLITDAAGRIRVLMHDDAAITLGGNTTFTLEAYAEAGKDSTFQSRLGGGLARVLTGKIVQANPDGFSVTTPQGHIGIRGTMLAVRVQEGATTVLVENTLRQVLVNGVVVPTEFKAVVTTPDGMPTLTPISPDDRRQIGRDLAFRGGAGVAAAAPEPDTAQKQAAEQGTGALPPGNTTLPVAPSGLAALPMTDMNTATLDMLQNNTLVPGTVMTPAEVIPLPVVATVTGSLMATPGSSGFASNEADFSGRFSFQVNLGSGAISNGSMSASSATFAMNSGLSYNLSGGTGSMRDGNMSINNFSGTLTYAGTTHTADPGSSMTGVGNINSVGGSVSGTYQIDGSTTTGWTPDQGSFNGTRRP